MKTKIPLWATLAWRVAASSIESPLSEVTVSIVTGTR
jgi:hypothetical protein